MITSLVVALLVLVAWAGLGVLGLYLILRPLLKDEEAKEDDVPDRGQ